MGDLFNQIGQLFVQATPTVIFVVILLFILKRLFFGPVAEVLKARDEQTKGALVRARERAALVQAKAAEYEAAWHEARQEIFALREADRRKALAARDEVIRQARARAEATVNEAQASLEAQGEVARRELAEKSVSLARDIAAAILPAPVGDSTHPASEVTP